MSLSRRFQTFDVSRSLLHSEKTLRTLHDTVLVLTCPCERRHLHRGHVLDVPLYKVSVVERIRRKLLLVVLVKALVVIG